MTPREAGFLLLTSHLGDPERKILTPAQLRGLAARVGQSERPREDRELTPGDLTALGYPVETARRVADLLSQRELLEWYVHRGEKAGCVPVTRVSPGYPRLLRKRLGLDAPGCLWAKGNLSLLDAPGIALVGSRELREDNRRFAREAGRQAARQGWVLASGNARGADREAQEACLASGGSVISVVADSLMRQTARENVLYLSEDGFDLPFSPLRALSRNRVIHCLGQRTLVAQCGEGTGGTWDGTVKNLAKGWSPVFCCDDGSAAAATLEDLGASLISREMLADLSALADPKLTFFDP